MIYRDNRSPDAKVRLFREFFSGLEHVYGTYDLESGRSWQVKRPLTDDVVRRHLRGEDSLGLYLLTGDVCRAVVADFDDDDANGPLDFLAAAEHYGLPVYIERSKSKGYHAWVFLSPQGVSAAKARAVFKRILSEVDCPDTEIFPKQDRLDGTPGSYGNFINTPLFGLLVAKGRTVFLDPKNGLVPFSNQWAFLDSIVRVSEQQLDEMIEVNEIPFGIPPIPKNETSLGICLPRPGSLPLCTRRLLTDGTVQNQRVLCFLTAVNLKGVGIPLESAIAVLMEWKNKNRPLGNKRIITEVEVREQTAAAYMNGYRGYGCDNSAIAPFCDEACPLNKKRKVSIG